MKRKINFWRLGWAAAAAWWVGLGTLTPGPARAETSDRDAIVYNRDIRPILSDNCFYCHGPDKNKRKGKFRLDDRESAVAKKAIVPGKPAESSLVDRIFTKDPEDLMPPPETHKALTEAQKQLLVRWVEQGAVYQPHWAYIPPQRPPVPVVANAAEALSPIDAFIQSTLVAKKIAPSNPADPRTLLRRLSLDLTGLPPTPAETQAYLDDRSPDAYARQVDRLLASPHYGERMAVPWLDAVRFADTVGFHGDQNVNVFPYRDYVIDAFNHNKPFDQFTIEQIAGDLLPHPTTEQLVASGFNRLNMMTREGGAQPKEYLAKYAADRVRTVGSAWLGSTLGCCECHDHKFDPFTARDFYSMGAFWSDVRQWGVYMDYGYTPNPDLKGYSNDSPFPPEIVVGSPYLATREHRLIGRVDEIAARAGARFGDDAQAAGSFEAWRVETSAFLDANPDGWAPLDGKGLREEQSLSDEAAAPTVKSAASTTKPARSSKAAAPTVVAQAAPGGEGSVLLLGAGGNNDVVRFALPAGRVAAIRLEALPHSRHDGRVVRNGGESALVSISATLRPHDGGKDVRLTFDRAEADQKEDRFSNGFAIIGVLGGWKTSAAAVKQAQSAVYVLSMPVTAGAGDVLSLTLAKNTLGCIRVSVSPVASIKPLDPTFAKAVDRSLKGSAARQSPVALLAYLLSGGAGPESLAEAQRLARQVAECRDGKSPTLVTVAQPPRVARVLPRGNWQDESGPVVEPALPAFLVKPAGERRLTRLDLARWIVSPQNPLTARTIANRMWKQFFGTGLSSGVEDLGAQGEWPSHPELLDWLAVEFRESGWDVKHMARLIVMSSTYRQDSNLRPELKDIDPGNRLLASQSPRRLEAEFVRDNALCASGLLNLADIGGPSVKPYQPAGYYVNIQFPSRDYIADTDDRQYRRGLYMHWQRTFLHPMLANFDAPSREDTACTRVVSNTPQQALTLLNDPTFVEAARVLAERTLAADGADARRLSFIFERALAREPRPNERTSLEAFLKGQRSYYHEHPDDAAKLAHVGDAPPAADVDEPELAAWATVCRVVLNLHETITRY